MALCSPRTAGSATSLKLALYVSVPSKSTKSVVNFVPGNVFPPLRENSDSLSSRVKDLKLRRAVRATKKSQIFTDWGHETFYSLPECKSKKEKEVGKAKKNGKEERMQLRAVVEAQKNLLEVLLGERERNVTALTPGLLEGSEADMEKVISESVERIRRMETELANTQEAKGAPKDDAMMMSSSSSSSSSSSESSSSDSECEKERKKMKKMNKQKVKVQESQSNMPNMENPVTVEPTETVTVTAPVHMERREEGGVVELDPAIEQLARRLLGSGGNFELRLGSGTNGVSLVPASPPQAELKIRVAPSEVPPGVTVPYSPFSTQFRETETVTRVEVCMGKACRKEGAENLLAALQERAGEGALTAVPCGKCMKKCKYGPNVRLYEEGEGGRRVGRVVPVSNSGVFLQQLQAARMGAGEKMSAEMVRQ